MKSGFYTRQTNVCCPEPYYAPILNASKHQFGRLAKRCHVIEHTPDMWEPWRSLHRTESVRTRSRNGSWLSWSLLWTRKHRPARTPGLASAFLSVLVTQGARLPEKPLYHKWISFGCRFPIDTRNLPEPIAFFSSCPELRQPDRFLVSIPRDSDCIRFMRRVQPTSRPIWVSSISRLASRRSGLPAHTISGSKTGGPNVSDIPLPKEVKNDSVSGEHRGVPG